jgi:hypothetical protein
MYLEKDTSFIKSQLQFHEIFLFICCWFCGFYHHDMMSDQTVHHPKHAMHTHTNLDAKEIKCLDLFPLHTGMSKTS